MTEQVSMIRNITYPFVRPLLALGRHCSIRIIEQRIYGILYVKTYKERPIQLFPTGLRSGLLQVVARAPSDVSNSWVC